jgi:hypothetical protein
MIVTTQQVDKEKRGKFLQALMHQMQSKGLRQEYAVELLEKWMSDPAKLSIINALAATT